ncbi:MAG: heparan-alpha-glucosaminide N-acetyltransferase domain-containing protein, partial [Gaiellaceae bacterium]
MGVAATSTPSVAARAPTVARIRGIDIARAVAIVGMVMVHIGPFPAIGGGFVGDLYRIPHGRASILFVVVAGIGVSLLARGRSSTGLRSTATRLGWRALILLPLGLALQELGTGVAVILQYYALFFLIAIVAARLSDRALLGVAAAMSVLGPLAVLLARRLQPEWFGPIPEWSAFGRIGRDLVISGTYPMLVWIVPLFVGLWIGRQDLRSLVVPMRLLVGGALLAAGAFGLRYWFEGVVGAADSRTDWLQLAAIEPHNEMPLWVLSA